MGFSRVDHTWIANISGGWISTKYVWSIDVVRWRGNVNLFLIIAGMLSSSCLKYEVSDPAENMGSVQRGTDDLPNWGVPLLPAGSSRAAGRSLSPRWRAHTPNTVLPAGGERDQRKTRMESDPESRTPRARLFIGRATWHQVSYRSPPFTYRGHATSPLLSGGLAQYLPFSWLSCDTRPFPWRRGLLLPYSLAAWTVPMDPSKIAPLTISQKKKKIYTLISCNRILPQPLAALIERKINIIPFFVHDYRRSM